MDDDHHSCFQVSVPRSVRKLVTRLGWRRREGRRTHRDFWGEFFYALLAVALLCFFSLLYPATTTALRSSVQVIQVRFHLNEQNQLAWAEV